MYVTAEVRRSRPSASGRHDIREHEIIALDDLASTDVEWAGEDRAGMDEGVELAVFAARVNAAGQIAKQVRAELPAGEGPVELPRIHAGERGLYACGDHVAGEFAGRDLPDREQRREAGPRKL